MARAHCRSSEEKGFHMMRLQQREALYSANHPSLADSTSNLAILYNERGIVQRFEHTAQCCRSDRRGSFPHDGAAAEGGPVWA